MRKSTSKSSKKKSTHKSMPKWFALCFLVLVTLLTLIVMQQRQNVTQEAQTLVTPTLYCLGACPTVAGEEQVEDVPDDLEEQQAADGEELPAGEDAEGLPAEDGEEQPATEEGQPEEATQPCPATDNSIGGLIGGLLSALQNDKGGRELKKDRGWGRHHHYRHRHHREGGGLMEAFLRFFMQLLQIIFQLPATPAPPPATADPCEPSDEPGGDEVDAEPTAEPTSADVTLAPTVAAGTSPSGQAMPKDDQAGWKLVFSDDFTTNVAVGSFPGSVYGSKWDVYTDGTPDSAGGNGKPSKYYPSKVVSVQNGVLNKYLHTENGTPMAAAIIPKVAGRPDGKGQIYGKYVVRFKADSLKGFKTAWLLWADQGDFRTQGEVDFPEGDLSGEIMAFLHEANAAGNDIQTGYPSGQKYTSWHTATIDWQPTKISFILDGKTIGSSTRGVPNTSMGYIIQTESCLDTCPAAATKGNLQIDWVAIYERK